MQINRSGFSFLTRIASLFVLTSIAVNGLLASEPRKIVVLGDSITAGYGLDREAAYPALLQEKVNEHALPYEVVNAGVSGDTTASGLRRTNWVLARSQPAVFVIALGGNDGLRGIPVEQTRANLAGIVQAVRQASPDTEILIAGMRMPESMGRDYAESFYETFSLVAEQQDAHLLPFLLEGVGGEASLNQSDQIHPNAAGQKQIAETVWSALEPLLVPKESI